MIQRQRQDPAYAQAHRPVWRLASQEGSRSRLLRGRLLAAHNGYELKQDSAVFIADKLKLGLPSMRKASAVGCLLAKWGGSPEASTFVKWEKARRPLAELPEGLVEPA
mmetsp:Transcript_136325/g.291139  ORF Transcript_136325/g.291139 Transcript_136325/m.291139 type:complete len:108 (-) Transcript_136325:388-711(-)